MIFHPRIRHIAGKGPVFIGQGPILSTFLSLSRNIEGFQFPATASANTLESVAELGLAAMHHEDVRSLLPSMFQIKHELLTSSDRELLVERELMDRSHTDIAACRVFVCAEDGSASVLLNGDDHLWLHMTAPGPAFRELWDRMSALESALARHLRFAFHPRFGYLTGAPSLAGTGLRIKFLIHLPALGLSGRRKRILERLEDAGLAAEPYFPVDGKAAGNLFLISNRTTLGEREEDLGNRMTEIVMAISREEERTRAELISRQKMLFLNACGRAYGLLRNSYLIPTSEALDALSIMKLGADSGVFQRFTRRDWAELLLECQPAHLSCRMNMNLSPVERGKCRAARFRERLHGPEAAAETGAGPES
jgi:protein arginine kinase